MSDGTMFAVLFYGAIAFVGAFLSACINENDRFIFSLQTICFGLIRGGLLSIPTALVTMLIACWVSFLMEGQA
jgi:hypothetical protein